MDQEYRFTVLFSILFLTLLSTEKNKLINDIYIYSINRSNSFANMGENKYSKVFLQNILFIVLIVFFISFMLFSNLNSNQFSIVGKGEIAILTILFIFLIEPIYENYITSKKELMTISELVNFEEQYKNDLNTIKIAGGVFIVLLSVIFHTGDYVNELINEDNNIDFKHTNFEFKKEKNEKVKLDTKNTIIHLKNGTKYKLEEIE